MYAYDAFKSNEDVEQFHRMEATDAVLRSVVLTSPVITRFFLNDEVALVGLFMDLVKDTGTSCRVRVARLVTREADKPPAVAAWGLMVVLGVEGVAPGAVQRAVVQVRAHMLRMLRVEYRSLLGVDGVSEDDYHLLMYSLSNGMGGLFANPPEKVVALADWVGSCQDGSEVPLFNTSTTYWYEGDQLHRNEVTFGKVRGVQEAAKLFGRGAKQEHRDVNEEGTAPNVETD